MERGLTEPLGDGALVARIGEGDQAAVTALHDRFAARIYFIALREMRSAHDAEDVRNETLFRVLEAIRGGRLASPAALPGFVVSTARNVIREFGRKDRRAEPILDRDFAAPMPDKPVDHQTRQAIELVIRRLKPRERAFVRLFYYDELPKAEISRRLGVSEERLRLVKSRALKTFREIYERLAK
jgi:RNA polymerase sigma-70 factor (ECF subfamily)